MKSEYRKTTDFFTNSITKTTLFLLLAVSATGVAAQKVNEDLEHKPVAKSTPRPKTATPKQNRNPREKSSRTSKTKQVAAINPQPATVSAPQTTAQIFDRFMNFQQSESVTSRDWETVISQSNATLQANPGDATAKAQLFIAQGYLAYNRGDYSNALIQFNAAADALPKSALPFYSIGKVYLVTRQPSEAEAEFEKAVKLNKDFALAYKGIGDALTAQGKTKKAQDYFKQAARAGLSNGSGVVANTAPNASAVIQNNQNSDPTAKSAESTYDIELKNARALTTRKKWQNSLDKLTPLSKTNPTADLYIAIGENYTGMQQWLSAQQAFRRATEVDPNSALGFYKLGSTLYQLNEFQSATEAFEKSLILDQQGKFINRQTTRKMADRAREKAKDAKGGKKKKFLGIG